jgi:DNA-binding response OmpR family regulator
MEHSTGLDGAGVRIRGHVSQTGARPGLHSTLARVLDDNGFNLQPAHDAAEAVRLLETGAPALLIFDAQSGGGAAEALRDAISRAADVPMYVLSPLARDAAPAQRLEAGPIAVDEQQRLVFVRDQELRLSRTEYGLIAYLARNQNRALSHDEILVRVWGRAYVGSHHVLRVTINRLRRKLRAADAPVIETLPGLGYRLRAA